MPQTIEVPDRGLVEFPDDISPDDIKGVIQKKFYSPDVTTTTPMPELSPVAVESAPAVLENQPSPTSVPGPGNVPTPPEKTGFSGILSSILGLPAKGIQGTFNTVAGSLTSDYWENPDAYVPTDQDVQTPLISGETVGNVLKTQIAGSPKVFEKSTGGLSGALRGILEGTGEAIASFSTPESLALLPFGGGGKTAQRVIAGVFEGQAIAGTPEQWEAFNAAETTADKVRIATAMGLGLALPAAAFAHTFKKPPPPKLAEILDPVIGDRGRIVDGRVIEEPARPGPEVAPEPPTPAPETVVEPVAPKVGSRIEGPALVDTDGNVIAQGKIGETHKDLLDRAMSGPDAERVLEAFTNDAQHVFLDDVGNVLNREQAAPVGIKSGQLPDGTTKVESQMLKAEKSNQFKIPHQPLGVPDIVDILVENGGVKSRTKENLDLWNDQPDLRGVYRQLLGGKLAPDQMAAIAAEHGFGDGTVASFWQEVDKAVQSRRSMRLQSLRQAKDQSSANVKDKAFSKEVLTPKPEREQINTSNMQVGDEMTVAGEKFKVTDIDPDTLDVTLEDGKKYGVQTVKDGEAVYVDSSELVSREQDIFAPADEVPTLRPGEEQGDLLSKQTEDLTLVGEKGTDFGKLADEEAAAKVAAEEAKALQDELQQEFPAETEGAQGAIGPGASTLSALPPAAVTRPIKSQRQIITDLAKGLDIPIRFGRLRTNKFAGYFLPKADLIGAKRANDLTIVTHEVGHKLDQLFSFSGDPAIKSELNVLGDPTTPGSRSSWTKSKTLKYKYGEGIAEFVRHWLTDPAKAAKDAPSTHAAFEKILDANKDVGDVLRQAQGDIEAWRTSEAQARVRSHISIGDNPNKTRYTLSQLTRDLVDDLHILRLATEEAKRRGGNLPPSQDPYLLARNLRGSYGMADTFVRSGVTDFRTRAVQIGTSLEDALKPISGRINDFRDWIVAKRAQELMRQGRETGLLATDVASVVKRFETDTDFQSAFQSVKIWNAHVLKYAVDSGLVTPEGATAMMKMNQDYVPLHRIFEAGAGESSSQQSMGTGSGLNAGKPGSMKKLTGSTREIVDPIETMVKNAYAIITASEKSAINNAVADLSRLPGMGKWVEHVAAPKEQVKVGLEKIREQLEDAGADISALPDDLALSFYRQSGRAPFGENTIRIIKNGKPEFYRLNRDLFDTFQALDLEDSGMLVRMLSAPAQVLRSGVVLEPSFALANVMRDTVSAAVIGKYGAFPFETTVRGLGAMIGNPKLVAEWAASGGKSSIEANYFDRTKLQKFVTERITKDLTPAERALVVVKSPLTALRWLTSLSEEATRIGEYQIALNKLRKGGMPAGEARRLAAFEARDRQDFAKGGAKTKIVRHMAAFWNAALQGNVKLAQTFKERPVRTLMQGFAFVTIPKLLEQAVNWEDKDYWDRPQWERDLFFLIPAGKDENNHTRFIRIPTPFEVGVIFGTLPGRIIQYAKQSDPKALTGYFKTLLQSTVPNPMPQGAQMIFEDFLSGKQGWDVYRGRPIVPDSLADQPPEMQWTEQTTTLARNIGELIGYSPMKIDHMIGQTIGGLGKVLTGQQVPGKRFVTTPLAVSNQSTQDFYDTLDKLRAGKKRHEADESVEFSPEKLKQFESTARELSELRKELRDSVTSAERKTQVREEIYQKVQEVMGQE